MKNRIKHYAGQFRQGQFSKIANWIVEKGVDIQQIPAPTFAESARAQYVMKEFHELGLDDISIDAMDNVYGLIRGENRTVPGIMLMAHTDTVFPAKTDLTIQRKRTSIYGPGLGDNSIGVSGMMGLAYFLKQMDIVPSCDLWFVATSCEEGLGNLNGARLAYETLCDKIGLVINIEGLAFGYIYHAGIAVRRLHIVAHAPGGHSWLHFGKPSATHTIVQLGAAITKLTPPESPRTTYNIGMLEGGQSINSIAMKAGMWLDLRSEDRDALMALEDEIRVEIQKLTTPDITFDVEVVGDRPSGRIDVNHPLIQGAMAALDEMGVRGTLQIGSTDGNIPLSNNCPTVTIGITRGGNAHRLDEYIELAAVESGLRQLVLLTLASADYQTKTE